MNILIIINSLRIGGVERNALDQAYELYDQDSKCTILVLNREATEHNANFIENEQLLIDNKKVKIIFAKQQLFLKLRLIAYVCKNERPNLIIDYTLSMSSFLQLLKKIQKHKVSIHSVAQQFAGLSAPIQRYKRFFYSQFPDKFFINSCNYREDWIYHLNSGLVSRFCFRKKIYTIRNGVYIPRLINQSRILEPKTTTFPRFVFLGRLKDWKGVFNLRSLDFAMEGSCEFLILTSDRDSKIESYLKDCFGTRITFIFGKTLDSYKPSSFDIHVYPVTYGQQVRGVESVSTNCLEMAVLGIPSLVTKGGTANWPELTKIGVIQEVDWNDTDSLKEKINTCISLVFDFASINQIIKCVDIKNNLMLHFKYLS